MSPIFLIICLIAGMLGGILQGMLGIGMAIIAIPLLTFILPYYGISSNFAVHVAIATSMAAIVFSSISSTISHHKRHNIRWDIFQYIIVFSMLGSLAGALIASDLPARALKIIFSAFMFLTAAKMLLKKSLEDSDDVLILIPRLNLSLSGFAIGVISGLVGIAGGLLTVPYLHWLKIKMRYAVGTSTVIGLPIALVGALTYLIMGLHQPGLPLQTIGYIHGPALIAIALGGVACAPLGARLATHLPSKLLQRGFAVCIIIVGVKMLF